MALHRRSRFFDLRVVFTSDDPPGSTAKITRRPWNDYRTLRASIVANRRAGTSYILNERRRVDVRILRRHSDSTYDRPFDTRFFMDGGTYGRTMAIMTEPVRAALIVLADAGAISFADHRLKFRGTIQHEQDMHRLWPLMQLVFTALTEPMPDDSAIFERIASRFSDEPNERVRASFCYFANASRSPRGYARYAKAAMNDPSLYVRAAFAGYCKDFPALMKLYTEADPASDARNHCASVFASKDNSDAAIIERAITLDLTSDLYLIDLLLRLAALRGKDAIPVIENAFANHAFAYPERKRAVGVILVSLGSDLAGQVSLAESGGQLSRT